MLRQCAWAANTQQMLQRSPDISETNCSAPLKLNCTYQYCWACLKRSAHRGQGCVSWSIWWKRGAGGLVVWGIENPFICWLKLHSSDLTDNLNNFKQVSGGNPWFAKQTGSIQVPVYSMQSAASWIRRKYLCCHPISPLYRWVLFWLEIALLKIMIFLWTCTSGA